MIEKKHINNLSKLLPYIYATIISDNEELLSQENISRINSLADKILRSIDINEKYFDEYKFDLISTITEIISSNIILFDDPNYEWTEHFVYEFFENHKYKFSLRSDDLKLVVINSLSLTVKEYMNFHNSLFFSNKISIDEMKDLNVNILNRSTSVIIDLIEYISNNLGEDFLMDHIKLAGRIYAYSLSGLFNSLLKNPHRIIDYKNKQQKFLKNVEDMFLENYSSLIVKTNLITNKIEGNE